MKKLKVSWSILQAWGRGDTDSVVKMIQGKYDELPTNEYMERGKDLHAKISKKKLKLLPFITDSAIYEDFDPENDKWKNYFKVELFDWLEFGFVIDLLCPEEKWGLDWKATSGPSSESNKLQGYCYSYAIQKLEDWKLKKMGLTKPIKLDRFYYARVEQDPSGAIICSDYSEYLITVDKLDVAENYIVTYASEIYDNIFG